MLKMNLQFFAHKKGVGSTKNGRDSSVRAGTRSRQVFTRWNLPGKKGM